MNYFLADVFFCIYILSLYICSLHISSFDSMKECKFSCVKGNGPGKVVVVNLTLIRACGFDQVAIPHLMIMPALGGCILTELLKLYVRLSQYRYPADLTGAFGAPNWGACNILCFL